VPQVRLAAGQKQWDTPVQGASLSASVALAPVAPLFMLNVWSSQKKRLHLQHEEKNGLDADALLHTDGMRQAGG
jgi:hypothetical protein